MQSRRENGHVSLRRQMPRTHMQTFDAVNVDVFVSFVLPPPSISPD